MAAPTESHPSAARPSLNSYQTALCVVPPSHICRDIDRIRSSHDKAYGRWPAHINLIYPFVTLESLPQAIELIRSKLNSLVGTGEAQGGFSIYFDSADSFSHRHSSTIFLAPIDFDQGLKRFRSILLEAFGRDAGVAPSSREEIYHPHLTVGQSTADGAEYLMSKASLLLPLEWDVGELVILVRERLHDEGDASASQMKVWGVIGLNPNGACEIKRSADIHRNPQTREEPSGDFHDSKSPGPRQETTYHFSEALGIWEPTPLSSSAEIKAQPPSTLAVSSYNVLADSTLPPAQDRYPLLARALLSEHALADIVVMQEVSDSFLSFLLQIDSVRSRWPFVTHGPPRQHGIGPMPSLRNIVVLSRWNFRWEWVPFEQKHKGTAVLVFADIGVPRRPTPHSTGAPDSSRDEANFLPLVLSGVHLTSGLTDSAVAAKESQLYILLNHLSKTYAENPWIVAGDFNVTTSTVSVDASIRSKSISTETADTLSSLDTLLSEARLSDAWFMARAETVDTTRSTTRSVNLEDIQDGEEGATFNPLENALALKSSLDGRPQRYDRILIRGEDTLKITEFGMFGFAEEEHEGDDVQAGDEEPQLRYGSDHWGIRATLRIDPDLRAKKAANVEHTLISLEPTKAPKDLADITLLKSYLARHAMLPTEDEADSRKAVFALLKSILRQTPMGVPPTSENTHVAPLIDAKPNTLLVIVPVGSYGLGVWNASSDIDCLCVGSISTKTFFALASQRLRKAADLGVRILRTVKAASGTMLELDIRGVRLDLQYCPATKVAERWSEMSALSPTDPLFDLSISSLKKLNAYRDMDYLQRTIPDLAAFRLAHRFIRTWAQQRGIYSARFGYLGGIHITFLLSRVCKLLFRNAGAVTAADIICTFFSHYANFDWKTDMAFDPCFYKQQRPRYQRSATREPAVILSLHAPAINVAHAASFPSARTLIEELQRADRLLSDVGITWSKLVDGVEREEPVPDLPSGAHEFLKSYSSYIRIDVQYWGASLAKGSALVGWLESRCVLLLVDFNRKLPDIHARIWPARFTHKKPTTSPNSDGDSGEYHGCYLIGLAKGAKSSDSAATSSTTESSDRRKLAQGALRNALEQFTEQIHGDEKYFDAKTSWVEVSHVKQLDLGDLALDTREWGNFAWEDDESETSEEEDADDSPEPSPSLLPHRPATTSAPLSSSSSKSKLRPAHDILHRLLWDPSLDPSDHVIGYIDRFSGTKEMAVEKWKTEKTDEEFVPMHRVVYFRRKSDGVRVWDREGRRDEVFGSGEGKGKG